jgi:CBS domain-containing protein/mannitol/fructose-specific phosphotransferase system IIA component (Ntr-type)
VKLGSLIAADRIVVPLPGGPLPVAAAALLDRLGTAVDDVGKLRQRMDEERPEDMVAMGDRAFLLHFRTDAARELVVALGTAEQPISRDVGDGEQQFARIVLFIVAPPRLAAQYLQLLAALSRLFSQPALVEAILAERSATGLARLLSEAEYEAPERLSVRDIMTERPRFVSADTPLRQAAQDMVRAGIGGLPVVDDEGRVIGMLSERELMRHLLDAYLHGASGGASATAARTPPGAGRRLVRDVMTRQVLCVSPDQPLAEVASIMTNKDVDRVPVVRGGTLVGLLTRGDIVRKLIGS